MNENRRWFVCPKLKDISISLKFSAHYEKDTTIESDSKQRTMSWQDQVESVRTETKRQIETDQFQIMPPGIETLVPI